MPFEFDQAKSEANVRKHGISLEDASRIWDGAHLEIAARTIDEPRFMAIGPVGGELYACIYTMREESVRLISCRRARAKEGQLYHDYFEEKISDSEGHGH